MSQLWVQVVAALQHNSDRTAITDAETGCSLTARALLAEVSLDCLFAQARMGSGRRRKQNYKMLLHLQVYTAAGSLEPLVTSGRIQADDGSSGADQAPATTAIRTSAGVQHASSAAACRSNQYEPPSAGRLAPRTGVETAAASPSRPGCTVAVWMAPSLEYVVAVLACVAIGYGLLHITHCTSSSLSSTRGRSWSQLFDHRLGDGTWLHVDNMNGII
jgi:hypothetical protein